MLKHAAKAGKVGAAAGGDDESTYILENVRGAAGNKSNAGGDGGPDPPGGGTPAASAPDTSQLIADCQEDDGGKAAGSSLSATAFNYVNSIIGSGVIGMPYALKESGVLLGLFTLCMVAALTDYSLILLVKNGNLSKTTTYQEMAGVAFGQPGYIILTIFQATYPFIAMTSYNVIVGDTITKIVLRVSGLDPTSIFARREFVIIATNVLVTLPLSLYKDIGKLAKVSFVSLIFLVFIAASIFVRFFTMSGTIPTSENSVTYFNFGGYSEAIGIMTFAFMCHHNSFLLYSAIDSPTQQKWNKVTHVSVWSSFVAILIFAAGGYITFLDYTQGDLLNNYCWADDLMNISRLLFTFTILLTYPIECFVVREVVENILFHKIGMKQSSAVHVVVTVAIVSSTLALALTTDCLGVVLVINGLLFAIPLAFIIPGACYLKLSLGRTDAGLDDDGLEGRWWNRLGNRASAAFIIAFGLFATAHGTAMMIMNGTGNCYHDVQMPYCVSPLSSARNASAIPFDPSVGHQGIMPPA